MENNKGKTIRMKLGFLKNNVIDNSLGILIKKKEREKTQTTNTKNKKWYINTDLIDIKNNKEILLTTLVQQMIV